MDDERLKNPPGKGQTEIELLPAALLRSAFSQQN